MRLLALLERGNENDIEAWGKQLLARVQKHVMRVNDKTVTVTCTVGLSIVPPSAAQARRHRGRCHGGLRQGRQAAVATRSRRPDEADNDNRVQAYDQVWVKHIKAALMENRFRLVQQPVASLQGDDPQMFDVVMRMLDTQGKEVLPSEFMPAAERNDLLKNIDRWVVGASLSFAAQRRPRCLFVRLSKDTARDATFIEWLDGHIRSTRAEPQRVCFQVTEEVAASFPQVRALAGGLRQRGFRFALESFGSGRDPQSLIASVPLDFVKIDGALIQSLARDSQLQQRVRAAGRLGQEAQHSDHRRAGRGRQHHGRAVAARACSTSRATSCTRPKKSSWVDCALGRRWRDDRLEPVNLSWPPAP